MATVLITGANRGIGLELVKAYAQRGEHVIACCRDPLAARDLEDVAKTADVDIRKVQVADRVSVAKLASDLAGTPIDLLINNAGTGIPALEHQTVYEMDFDAWAEAFAVNTMAPVRMMQALLDNLRASGNARLVTISSQLGALSLDLPYAYAYSSTKAAINKIMRLAAIDLAKDDISVCLIHPGWVRTDMGGPTADLSPEESVRGIVNVIDTLRPETSGSFWKWNGEPHDW